MSFVHSWQIALVFVQIHIAAIKSLFNMRNYTVYILKIHAAIGPQPMNDLNKPNQIFLGADDPGLLISNNRQQTDRETERLNSSHLLHPSGAALWISDHENIRWRWRKAQSFESAFLSLKLAHFLHQLDHFRLERNGILSLHCCLDQPNSHHKAEVEHQ